MMVLSIKQPWAYLIVAGLKDIENRTWKTKFRGRFIVHASKTLSKSGLETAAAKGIVLPNDLPRGAIVGSVELTDCLTASQSPWFEGPYGFALANAEPCAPIPHKGRLFFFKYQTL